MNLDENLAESSVKSSVKSLIIFYFDLVTENYYNNTDQSSYIIAELSSSLS